jgi:hypothetical protein
LEVKTLFGKDKKSSDCESIQDMIDRIQSESEALRRSAGMYSAADARLGHSVGSPTLGIAPTGCGTTTSSYVSLLDFEKVTHMLDVIYNEVTTVIPHSDGVDIIARALDGFQCPVEECKRCRYYLPGSVDGCDRTRALATHLLESGTVKIIPPKHIDKGKDT